MSLRDWQEVRDVALERDNRQCQLCSLDKDLEVHHILQVSLGGKDTLENLITLCSNCHKKLPRHKKPERDFIFGPNSNVSKVKRASRYTTGLTTKIPRMIVEKARVKENEILVWSLEQIEDGTILKAFIATEYLKKVMPQRFSEGLDKG